MSRLLQSLLSEVEFLKGKSPDAKTANSIFYLGLPEYKRGPWLGEDTNEILKRLGLMMKKKVNDYSDMLSQGIKSTVSGF